MMDKSQIMIWKQVGYDVQNFICLVDSNFNVSKLQHTADSIKDRVRHIDDSEIKKLNAEKEIAIPEYVDMLSDSLTGDVVDIRRARKCADAILRIVVDMSYGALKNGEYYMKIVMAGEVNG